MVKAPTPRMEFGTAFEQVKNLLQNPYLIWKEGDVEWRRLVQRLVFTTPLAYDRNSGFGTTELSLPYLISRRLNTHQLRLVDIPLNSWNRFAETVLEWAYMVEVMSQ